MPTKKKPAVSAEELVQLRTAMVLTFPNCFVPKGCMKRPLKIGIQKDLLDKARAIFPGLSIRHIKGFLADYCGGHNYFVAIRKGSARVGLDGTFCGFVTEDEEAYAKLQLKRLKERKRPAKRKPGPAKQSIGKAAEKVVSETPEQKLKRLEYWHHCNAMSDNFYVSSGRSDRACREIDEVKAEIERRKRA